MKLKTQHLLQPSSAHQNVGVRVGTNPDIPSGRGFISLLEAFRATGGTAPGEVVERLLQQHTVGNDVSLDKLICTGQVFGFEWRSNFWIPMFQFDADNLSIKTGVQRVRAILPAAWSGWGVACWFTAPNANLHGYSPADVLDADLDAVVSAAKSFDLLLESQAG